MKKFSELLGCASATNVREKDDFYRTPHDCTEALTPTRAAKPRPPRMVSLRHVCALGKKKKAACRGSLGEGDASSATFRAPGVIS